MTALSMDFTNDEQAKIVRIVNSGADLPRTQQALDEYINIILDEKAKPTESDIRNSTQDEFTNLFSRLKDKHE